MTDNQSKIEDLNKKLLDPKLSEEGFIETKKERDSLLPGGNHLERVESL